MANPTYEVMKVHWLPAVAAIAAPTAAEITAGTELTAFTPVAGISRTPSQNNASEALLGQGFIEEAVGTWGIGITVTFVRHAAAVDDDAWEEFDYKTTGFLMISPFGAPVTGSRVEVYPAESHRPIMQTPAENEKQKFDVQFAVTAEPSFDAVVAV